MPLLSVQTPPALVAPPPRAIRQQEAELLEAFDWGTPLPPAPALQGPAALSLAWLQAAATFDPAAGRPRIPFRAGALRREAEALNGLLALPQARVAAGLKALPLQAAGTALALWRWGRLQVRTGAFDPTLRRLWENRLLAAGPPLIRGYALRHSLCWALREQDEARFTELRSLTPPGLEDTLKGFQRLFGSLGAPSPLLRLWTLPGLDYQDLRLDELGTLRTWVLPAEDGPLPAIPAGTSWIIPSATGSLEAREASLSESLRAEGEALATRLRAAGRTARFAPSRASFEQLGLSWFPILIELDGGGNIRSILMGDAAPAKP